MLLLFQIFQVYVLWPSAGAGDRARHSDVGQAQTLHSQLSASTIEYFNQKQLAAAQHVLPDLNHCRDACQCDRDKSEEKTAIAWSVSQIQHSAGTSTRVSLQWLPDGPGSAVQCVFGDRIVKGQLITVNSGDSDAQKACAACASHATAAHF